MENTSHIAILPSPGMGHLIPMVALAEKLHFHHHVSATIIVPSNGAPPPAQLQVLESLPKGINYLFLPPVNLDDEVNAEIQIFSTIKLSLPFLGEALRSLIATKGLAALVVDLFGTDAFHVANEFQLDEMVSCEYRDIVEPIKIPGCIPIQGSDFATPVQERSSNMYKWFIQQVKQYNLAEGILLNSFTELEKGTIEALHDHKTSIYPIGPLILTGSANGSDRSECLKWLDSQSVGSVLFVSFGSGGILSYNQLTELAIGLEKSGHKFLWVVKSPNDTSSNVDFLGHSSNVDPLSYLPQGFLDRTKGKGLVVPFWAPQVDVLAHVSTGGFLTHCGWNSTLESIVNGVPLIAWPLYAEQKMNAAMLTDDLKVALRPKADKNGLVEQEAVANVVRALMEGNVGMTIRDKMNELKISATKVLNEDGSSNKSLSDFAIKLNNSKSG